MKLVNGKRYTNAYWALQSASHGPVTTTYKPRGRGDFNILEGLVSQKMLELRYSGPRQGKRYHITEQGLEALKQANLFMSQLKEAA